MRPSVWVVVALLLAGCRLGESVRVPTAPDGAGPSITVRVVRPNGNGPFPGVVLMHSCAGLVRGARHIDDWTRRLLGMGYVVAIPDSFSERGHPDGVCGDGMLVPAETRARDAYAALRQLEQRADVVADRIGLIGHSHGGWTVLATMDENIAKRIRASAGLRHDFTAAVAFYPACPRTWIDRYRPVAPILILTGELDDWTPAAPCQRLVDTARASDQPLSIVVYPGAYHSFDSYAPMRRVPEALQGRGATIGGDNQAREDSIKQVEAFFGRYLR